MTLPVALSHHPRRATTLHNRFYHYRHPSSEQYLQVEGRQAFVHHLPNRLAVAALEIAPSVVDNHTGTWNG